jgi:hypothetical protein
MNAFTSLGHKECIISTIKLSKIAKEIRKIQLLFITYVLMHMFPVALDGMGSLRDETRPPLGQGHTMLYIRYNNKQLSSGDRRVWTDRRFQPLRACRCELHV